MSKQNRETQLNSVLSDLISTVMEVYGGNDICPICGGESVGDATQVLGFNHDETCSLVEAIALCELESPSPYSLEQSRTGITPETLLDALRQCQHEFPGVLGITDPSDNDGVIIYMPHYSWYFGIHGENPEWDGNGYLDWNMHRTGIEDGKPYLDEYIGMGVAIDSKGWSLDQMVWKIGQVVQSGEIQQDLHGPIVTPCTFTCVHCADHYCHDNCPRCEMLWVSQMERDHNTQ